MNIKQKKEVVIYVRKLAITKI